VGFLGVSAGNPHWDQCGKPPLGFGIFPHWEICGCEPLCNAKSCACLGCDFLGFGFGFDLPPFVGFAFPLGWAIGQPKHIRATKVSVAGNAKYDLDEAERFDFALRRSNRMPLDAVVFEIFVGDRKPAIVFAPMAGKLDFDPI
jgi:hypothetical protein